MCVLMQVLVMEAILLISSWFPPSVPHVMRLIFLPSSVFSPYDRVDTPPAVLEVPHSLPVHWEAELALPFEGCPAAVRELRRIVIEHRIPANMPIEVSVCWCLFIHTGVLAVYTVCVTHRRPLVPIVEEIFTCM